MAPQQPTGVLLAKRRDWPAWFIQLRFHALQNGVWEYVDPHGEEAPDLTQRVTRPPTLDELRTRRQEEAQREYVQLHTDWAARRRTRQPNPADTEPLPPPTFTVEDVREEHAGRIADHGIQVAERKELTIGYRFVWNWVYATVDREILSTIQSDLVLVGNTSIQALVRALENHLAPTVLSTVTTVRDDYLASLQRATATMNPEAWYQEWYRAYQRARAYEIPEIQGVLASRTFLEAVGKRLAPSWAEQSLIELITAEETGKPTRSVVEYGAIFAALVNQRMSREGRYGIYATLGGRPEPPLSTTSENSARSDPASSGGRGDGNFRKCPCGREHRWSAMKCSHLETALRGERAEYRARLAAGEKETILEALSGPEWSRLRDRLRSEGWITETPETPRPTQALLQLPSDVVA